MGSIWNMVENACGASRKASPVVWECYIYNYTITSNKNIWKELYKTLTILLMV